MIEISRQNVLMCKPILKSPVLRGGKYAVSRSLYPLETWPTFCFGGAWIASIDVIKKLVQASKFVPQVRLFSVMVFDGNMQATNMTNLTPVSLLDCMLLIRLII